LIFSFVSSLTKPKEFKKKTGLDYAILFFFLIVALSVFTSQDKLLSIYGLAAFCAYPAVYFLFSKKINAENIPGIARNVFYSLLIVLAMAVVQVVAPGPFLLKNKGFFDFLGLGWEKGLNAWPGTRLVSTLGNPNVLGAYLILVLPVLACFFLYKPSYKTGIIFIAGALCLFFTYSRAAWIGFFAGILTIAVISRRRLIVLLCLLMMIPFAAMPGLRNRLVSIFRPSAQYGNVGRSYAWQASINMIKAHPLLGTGINTYYRVYPEYQPPGSTDRYPHAHNVFLQIGAETGLTGLMAFCVLVILFLKLSVQTYRKYAVQGNGQGLQWLVLGIIGSTAGFLVQNIGDCTFVRGQMGVMFWAMMGIVKGFSGSIEEQK